MSVHSVVSGDDEGPRPGRGEGLGVWAALQGPPSSVRGVGQKGALQRQRIDMTRPITIAPKPMAKFQADNETMNGILSPAT